MTIIAYVISYGSYPTDGELYFRCALLLGIFLLIPIVFWFTAMPLRVRDGESIFMYPTFFMVVGFWLAPSAGPTPMIAMIAALLLLCFAIELLHHGPYSIALGLVALVVSIVEGVAFEYALRHYLITGHFS